MDLVRGLAALTVLAGHLRSALIINYESYSSVNEPGILLKIFYFTTGLGHEAVVIFFILSGFFVGGSIIKNLNEFNFLIYTINRLTRLWVVLIPALILTVIVNVILKTYCPDFLINAYSHNFNSLPTFDKYSTSFLDFLGNIFFLQGLFVPIFGVNEPLWSLSYEFWFYFLFPFLLILIGKIRSNLGIRYRFIASIFFIGIFFAVPTAVVKYFFIWLIGVGVFIFINKFPIKVNPFLLFISIILFLAGLIYARSTSSNLLLIDKDIVLGISFTYLCILIVNENSHKKTLFREIIERFSINLSNISYSLYLSHFPFIILVIVFDFKFNQLVPNFIGIFIYLIYLGGLISIGWIFWWLFERRTYELKNKILRIFI